MLILNLPTTDPFFNLAADEYLLKSRNEDFLVLYFNEPSVVIGKHQVAHREADTGFVTERNIPVIRRISGGGAVYHDTGNLNFSFILNSSHGRQVDFRKYTQPVIGFLEKLGIMATFEGKNDIKVDGLKISGNAEHVFRERVLHHGTLLFDVNMDNLKRSLRGDNSYYHTRAVASNPSPVMNLRERISWLKSNTGFAAEMERYFLKDHQGNLKEELKAQDINEIELLAETRYRKWEWNYAYGPEYSIDKELVLKGVLNQCSLEVRDGIIADCRMTGSQAIEAIAHGLIGLRHMPLDLGKFLNRSDINISNKEIFSFF